MFTRKSEQIEDNYIIIARAGPFDGAERPPPRPASGGFPVCSGGDVRGRVVRRPLEACALASLTNR